jgi:hypothetical protein
MATLSVSCICFRESMLYHRTEIIALRILLGEYNIENMAQRILHSLKLLYYHPPSQ